VRRVDGDDLDDLHRRARNDFHDLNHMNFDRWHRGNIQVAEFVQHSDAPTQTGSSDSQ